jgi:hypothetical protein
VKIIIFTQFKKLQELSPPGRIYNNKEVHIGTEIKRSPNFSPELHCYPVGVNLGFCFVMRRWRQG